MSKISTKIIQEAFINHRLKKFSSNVFFEWNCYTDFFLQIIPITQGKSLDMISLTGWGSSSI